MRRYFLLSLAVILLCSFASTLSWNEKVTQAAQKGLPAYLNMIPPGMKEKYGFFSGDDLKKCTIGKPYRILTPAKAFYTSQDAPDVKQNASLLQISNEWRVPVLANGKCRTLLTVTSNVYSDCQVVDIGGAVLAQELQQASANAGKDDDLYIMRVYPLAADFFVNAKTGSINDADCYPLTSATMSMSLSKRKSYSINEVLAMVKTTMSKPQN